MTIFTHVSVIVFDRMTAIIMTLPCGIYFLVFIEPWGIFKVLFFNQAIIKGYNVHGQNMKSESFNVVRE